MTVSDGTQHRIKLVELDLMDMQLPQKVVGKGLELLGSFDQPRKHGVGIDAEYPRRAPDAQTFGETGNDPNNEVR